MELMRDLKKKSYADLSRNTIITVYFVYLIFMRNTIVFKLQFKKFENHKKNILAGF